jgi:hypothetical protein
MKPLLLGEKLLHYETMILEDVLTEAGLTSKWLEQGREEGVEEKALKAAWNLLKRGWALEEIAETADIDRRPELIL